MDLARRMRDRLHYKADIISFMRERIRDIIMMVVNLKIGTETLNAKKIIRGNKKVFSCQNKVLKMAILFSFLYQFNSLQFFLSLKFENTAVRSVKPFADVRT